MQPTSAKARGHITLDRQHATEICEHCREPIAVSRGSVYDDGRLAGLYLAGMHRCDIEPVAILALALLPPEGGQPQAVHLRVRESSDAVEMVFLDPGGTPGGRTSISGRCLPPRRLAGARSGTGFSMLLITS